MYEAELKNWESNLFNCLKDISDLEYQKLSWTGKLPDIVSSFTEVTNIPYDFGFEEYIKYLRNKEECRQLYLACVELDNMINNYSGSNKSDIEILEDPDWKKITEKAGEILNLWNK